MKEAMQSASGVSAPQSTGNTIGVDRGDRWSRYCVLDESGTVLEEGRVRTSAAALEQQFKAKPTTRIVVEVALALGASSQLHSGTAGAGQPIAAMGSAVSLSRWEEWQEASRGGGSTQAGRVTTPALGYY